MSKKILTIGLALASDQVETLEFSSKASLLDWDIVLFRPDVSTYYSYGGDKRHWKRDETGSDRRRSARTLLE